MRITAETTMRPDVLALWKTFIVSGNEKARKCLIEHYWPLVQRVARRMLTKLPGHVELDELVSAGALGLISAVDAYEPDRSVKFETYSASRIRGAMLDGLRASDWASRLCRRRWRQLDQAACRLETELGRKPTEDELAQRMDLPLQKFRKLQQSARVTEMVSLDRPHPIYDGDKSVRRIDTQPSRHAGDPARLAAAAEIKEVITGGLNRTERLIILMYYFKQMTMKEIGQTLDMSESRVSHIHSKILASLREHLKGRREELLSAGAQRATGAAMYRAS